MAEINNTTDNYLPNHRFLPTEGPRQVVEDRDTHPTKFAGEVGFDPVTTVSVEDKNVYVKPVRNTYSRSLSPNVVGSSGQISVRGEKVVDLGEKLHQQIRAKINNAVSDLNYQPETNEAQKYITSEDTNLNLTPPRLVKPAESTSQSQEFNTKSKLELEEINKLLFEQIRHKVASELTRQQESPITTNPEPVNPVSAIEDQNAGQALKPNSPKPVQARIKPDFRKSTIQQIPEHWTRPEPRPAKILEKPKTPPIEPTSQDLKLHINKLETEIKILVKEIEGLDQTIKLGESSKAKKDLTNLEKQIAVDQKMLSAIAEWRLALNNLINSHSIAIKYLTEKSDWLEQNSSHAQKHEKFHSQTKNLNLDQKPLTNSALDTATTSDQPPYIKAVRDLVDMALKMEGEFKETNVKVNKEFVKEIVKETLQQQKLQNGPEVKQGEIKLPQPLVAESKPEVTAPTENPPEKVADTATKPDTIDIEKQILAQAEKEADVKEAIRRSKEEHDKAEKIKAEEKSKVEAAANQPVDSANTAAISADILKAEFDKLKGSLTRFDTSNFTHMPKQQRTDMIKKLENLEKESVVSAQFDEIKAAAERRRINQELAGMLHLMGEKTPEPVVSTQETQQKMETLKTEEKKQTTPAEKARLIAEIKELERQSKAKKMSEQSRPTVKAQPAFGKMLPNTPTTPNVINGIVKDKKGLLLSTVVIIVTDSNGTPVRAFKTNKIGQFALSTPVPNGVYRLELEKEGFDFDLIEVEVNGTILPPIEIKAK